MGWCGTDRYEQPSGGAEPTTRIRARVGVSFDISQNVWSGWADPGFVCNASLAASINRTSTAPSCRRVSFRRGATVRCSARTQKWHDRRVQRSRSAYRTASRRLPNASSVFSMHLSSSGTAASPGWTAKGGCLRKWCLTPVIRYHQHRKPQTVEIPRQQFGQYSSLAFETRDHIVNRREQHTHRGAEKLGNMNDFESAFSPQDQFGCANFSHCGCGT